MNWMQKVDEKRKSCSDAIPSDWKIPDKVLSLLSWPLEANINNLINLDVIRLCEILTQKELEITENYSTGELLKKLAAGELTSVEVTTAFCKRAAVGHQLTSCLTEIFFDDALKRAKLLDDLREQGQPCGPLHGLPVSLKDSFRVTGTQSTLGIVSFLDKPKSTSNSVLVDMLHKLGAVTYVKTNIPQTLATVDSENNIFGRTLNPWNTMLGPGGSSGGEGALVAFRGSPLGVGTDVGGSIRIPSLCCGVYGFKPSINRIPYGGQQDCAKSGIPGFIPAAGPLCNDLRGLKILTRAVLQAVPAAYDSTAIDVPWRHVPDVSEKKLRIGLLPEDPIYPLHPPVARALAEAAKILEASGHQIVPLPSAQCHVADATEVTWPIFLIDDTAYKHVEAGGEPLVQSVKYLHGMARDLERRFVPETDGLDRLDRLAVLNTKKAEIIEDWRSIWNDVDVVLSPPAQSTAVEHDKFGLPPYTTLTNLLDCPSCIIPFGRVSDQDLGEPFTKGPKQLGPEYNPHLLRGAPCSVQLITKTLHDEECLAYAEVVDRCLQGSGRR
ncbi:hypothetical protein Neosp_009578 [[Neocosmospora] mangrovei]